MEKLLKNAQKFVEVINYSYTLSNEIINKDFLKIRKNWENNVTWNKNKKIWR